MSENCLMICAQKNPVCSLTVTVWVPPGDGCCCEVRSRENGATPRRKGDGENEERAHLLTTRSRKTWAASLGTLFSQKHTHKHTRSHTHTHTHAHTQTHTRAHTQTHSCTHTNTLVHTHKHTRSHTQTHSCTHTNKLVHTHTLTHTHMQSQPSYRNARIYFE